MSPPLRVMVPCPWFPGVVSWCRDDPTLDIGLHITLTSEWPHCRWRPVSRPAPDSGLVDNLGYLHPEGKLLSAGSRSQAVLREMDGLGVTRVTGWPTTIAHRRPHVGCHGRTFSCRLHAPGYPVQLAGPGLPEWPASWLGREAVLAKTFDTVGVRPSST